MPPSRVHAIVSICAAIAVAAAATGAITASVQQASAQVDSWPDIPACNNPSANPYVYLEGPPAFWHQYSYLGGPNNGCEYWTENNFTFYSVSNNNSVYWYLPKSGGTGYYQGYPFEPSQYSTTKYAVYGYWPNGHQYSTPGNECTFSQWASAYGNFEQLCSADLGAQEQYFCSDTATNCGGFWMLSDATGEPALQFAVAADNLTYCNSPNPCVSTSYALTHASYVGVPLINKYSLRCLDADLNTIGGNGTVVQLWDCGSPDASQYRNKHWECLAVAPSPSTACKIVNFQSGRCLDADLNSIGANGTRVQLWDCGNPLPLQQQWTLSSGGRLQSAYPPYRCLDADLGTINGNGTRMQLWDCGSPPSDQQTWSYSVFYS